MSERVVLDKAGRIVLPKPLRTRLGMEAGDLLLVEELEGSLRVRRERVIDGLVERDGLLFKPKNRKAGAIDPEMVNRLIDTMRDPIARAELERREAQRARRRKKRK
jgi:AbrB family looped-hinge helix DNA binding protein